VSEEAAANLRAPFTTARPAMVAGRHVVVTIGPNDAAAAIGWAQHEHAAGEVEEFAMNPASIEDVYIGLLGDLEEAGRAANAA
jgi:ABC-2 type transport system ATP-binding protein